MALNEMRAAIDGALAGLQPTLPLALEDSIAVWTTVRDLVHEPFRLDVYHDRTRIIVQVHYGAAHQPVIRRELRAS